MADRGSPAGGGGVTTVTGEDHADATSPAAVAKQTSKPKADKAGSVAAAAPRSYQRLLFQSLRSIVTGDLCEDSDASVLEAALRALPWMLNRFCAALKAHRATLAAGELPTSQCNQESLRTACLHQCPGASCARFLDISQPGF